MDTIDLEAAASPAAVEALNAMLKALQSALREVLGYPPGLSGWTPSVQASVDTAFDAYDRYLHVVTRAHPVSCRNRCSACCCDNPRGVTGVELLRLSSVVDARSDGTEIRRKFREYAEKKTAKESWRALKNPCPLLKEGSCSVYPVRPVACRAFVAFTEAEWCDPQHIHFEKRLNPHLDPPKVILQLLAALSDRLGLVVTTDLHTGMSR